MDLSAANLTRQFMKEVMFSAAGEAVSDFEAEEYAYRLLECDKLHVSSGLVVDYVRVMIAEGAIPHTEVEFVFDPGYNLPVVKQQANKHGRLAHYPRGFCDHHMDALTRLLNHG